MAGVVVYCWRCMSFCVGAELRARGGMVRRGWQRSAVAVVLGLLTGSAAAETPQEALFAFAGEVAQHLLTQEYKELSLLHYYPGRSGLAAAGEESCQVEYSLRDMVGQFGELQNLRPLANRVMFMGLGSGSGDPAYWRTQPGAYTFTYEADFSKAGHGILKLEVVNFAEKPRLKAINFGLPASEQALGELRGIAATVSESRRLRDQAHICQPLVES